MHITETYSHTTFGGTAPTPTTFGKIALMVRGKAAVEDDPQISSNYRSTTRYRGPNVGAQLRPAASPRFTKKLSFTRDSRNPEAIPSGVSWSDMLCCTQPKLS